MQLRSGAAEMQLLGHCDEVPELANVHTETISPARRACRLLAVVLSTLFAVSHRLAGGRSRGKGLFGIAVRHEVDGSRVSLARLRKRELCWSVMLAFFVVPSPVDHGAALRDEKRQTRHDRAARTIVVREPLAMAAHQPA